MDELVSVIIPAYNADSTIVETLESVRAQTHPDFEIIVIDDGSTDNTAAIVESFARGDRRIRLVRKPNGGLPSARNAGIAVARGAFIAEVDADDLWHPHKLATEVAAMRRLGASVGMVYCWGWRIDERSRLLPSGFICHAYEGETYAALILQNFVVSPVYRAEAIRAIGGYDEGLRDGCEDLDCYLRFAERFDIAHVPRIFYGYRQTRQTMSRKLDRLRAAFLTVMARARHRHPRLPARLFRIADANFCLHNGKRSVNDRRWGTGAAYLSRALCRAPAFSLEAALSRLLDGNGVASPELAALAGRPFLPPPPGLDAFRPPGPSSFHRRLGSYVRSLAIDRQARPEPAGGTRPALAAGTRC